MFLDERENIMKHVRVSWQIEIDYNGVDESSTRTVLYLTKEQYQEFKTQLQEEEKFNGVISFDVETVLMNPSSLSFNLRE